MKEEPLGLAVFVAILLSSALVWALMQRDKIETLEEQIIELGAERDAALETLERRVTDLEDGAFRDRPY